MRITEATGLFEASKEKCFAFWFSESGTLLVERPVQDLVEQRAESTSLSRLSGQARGIDAGVAALALANRVLRDEPREHRLHGGVRPPLTARDSLSDLSGGRWVGGP